MTGKKDNAKHKHYHLVLAVCSYRHISHFKGNRNNNARKPG